MNLLGKRAKDKITGFEGTVTGKATYLYGCNQYCLVPTVGEKGEIRSSEWFDEGRLEVIGDGISRAEVSAERPGGPNRDCPR